MDRLGLIAVILVSVGLNASAQILLRSGARAGLQPADGWTSWVVIEVLLRPAISSGLACYTLSILVWIYVLSRTEASFAYPFLGLGFIVVAFAARQVLGERITLQRLAGILLMSAGVFVLATS